MTMQTVQRPRTSRRQRADRPAERERSRLDLTALEANGLRRYLGAVIARAAESLDDDAYNFVDAGEGLREATLATREKVRADLASIAYATRLLDGDLGWTGPASLTRDHDTEPMLVAARDHALKHMHESAYGGDWYGDESVQEAAIIAHVDRMLGASDERDAKVQILIDGALLGATER